MHRRRIYTEKKLKVVATVWGVDFSQFLAALAILPRTILKNRMNSFFSFKSSWCNSPYSSNGCSAKQAARQGIVFILSGDDLCLFFCIYPSFMPPWVGTENYHSSVLQIS